MYCDRFEMSQDKLPNLLLLISFLSQVDVDVVVAVRAGIQQNFSGGWSNIHYICSTSPPIYNTPNGRIFDNMVTIWRKFSHYVYCDGELNEMRV